MSCKVAKPDYLKGKTGQTIVIPPTLGNSHCGTAYVKEEREGEGKIEMLGQARCGESQQGYRDPVLGLGFPSL